MLAIGHDGRNSKAPMVMEELRRFEK